MISAAVTSRGRRLLTGYMKSCCVWMLCQLCCVAQYGGGLRIRLRVKACTVFGKLTRWIFMVATDQLNLCSWTSTKMGWKCSVGELPATLADEVGKARQGDGDRVAKQARPVTAKTRRSTRYHIAREFLMTGRRVVREFRVDQFVFGDRRMFS